MKLIATKSMRYGGEDLQPGDDFEASDRDGRLLKAIGKADDFNAEAVPDDDGEDATKLAQRRDNAYQSRSMKAKD